MVLISSYAVRLKTTQRPVHVVASWEPPVVSINRSWVLLLSSNCRGIAVQLTQTCLCEYARTMGTQTQTVYWLLSTLAIQLIRSIELRLSLLQLSSNIFRCVLGALSKDIAALNSRVQLRGSSRCGTSIVGVVS